MQLPAILVNGKGEISVDGVRCIGTRYRLGDEGNFVGEMSILEIGLPSNRLLRLLFGFPRSSSAHRIGIGMESLPHGLLLWAYSAIFWATIANDGR